jgi:hypothetical protein
MPRRCEVDVLQRVYGDLMSAVIGVIGQNQLPSFCWVGIGLEVTSTEYVTSSFSVLVIFCLSILLFSAQLSFVAANRIVFRLVVAFARSAWQRMDCRLLCSSFLPDEYLRILFSYSHGWMLECLSMYKV